MENPRSGFINANGINHHYLEWGEPTRPTLLMLHATGLCAHPWQPIAASLASEYHVMALDQRGHGDSDPSEQGYSFPLVGADVAAVIESLNLADVYLVGHSSGGLAILIADHLLPGRIRKAVLVETRVGARPASANPEELQVRAQRTRMKRSIWESREAMYSGYRQRGAFKDWQEEAFQAYITGGTRLLADGQAQLKCLPEVEAIFYEQRDDLDVTQYLKGLTGEYLLLLADYPGCQTPKDAGVQTFLNLVRGAQVKPLGVGSHFVPMEYPERVLQETDQFFATG